MRFLVWKEQIFIKCFRKIILYAVMFAKIGEYVLED